MQIHQRAQERIEDGVYPIIAVPYTWDYLWREILLLEALCHKKEAILWVHKQGFALQCPNVNGLSQVYVDKVIRGHEAQQAPQPEQGQEPAHEQEGGVKTLPNKTHTIHVDSTYHVGKTARTIRDAMRKANPPFPDHIIALVLKNKCELKSTEIGRHLYSGRSENPDDKTVLNHAKKLLRQANGIEISDTPV